MMSCISSLDGIVILFYDFDQMAASSRTGAELSLIDVQNCGVARVDTSKYSKEALSNLYNRLEELYKAKDLRMETMKPVFVEFGLQDKPEKKDV